MHDQAGGGTGASSGLRSLKRAPVRLIVGAAAILGVLLAIGLWPRWHGARVAHADAEKETTPLVTAVLAERGKAKADLTLPASLHPMQEATLYARTNGYLRRWHVDLGDQVKSGQLLAEIEAPEVDRELQQVRASIGQIRANLELARHTAERYRVLAREDAVSPQEVDERFAAVEARKADFAAAEAHIQRLEQLKGFQRVTAPFSGIVTARNVDIGSLITSGSSSTSTWLFKLVQADTLRVRVAVPQNHMRLVKPGMEGELAVREVSDKAFTGKVARVAGAFDPATRTMTAELLVPNPERQLMPGMYGQVKFHLVNPSPPLIVPVTALMIGGDGIRVATVDGADTVRFRAVKVGRDLGKEVEVLDGLADKERVINNPRDTMVDGQRVRVVMQEKHGDKDGKPAAPAPPQPGGAPAPATPQKS